MMHDKLRDEIKQLNKISTDVGHIRNHDMDGSESDHSSLFGDRPNQMYKLMEIPERVVEYE
jgi:hypothetical protein